MSGQLALEVDPPFRFDVVCIACGQLLDTFMESELATLGTGKELSEASQWAHLTQRRHRPGCRKKLRK